MTPSPLPIPTTPSAPQPRGTVDQLVDQAQRLGIIKNWEPAIQHYEAALAADPHHLPARAGLYEARQAIDNSQRWRQAAEEALRIGDAGKALEFANNALTAWPGNAAGAALRGQAQARVERADQAYRQGLTHLSTGAYDDAIAAAEAARREHVFHAPAGKLLRDARRSASLAMAQKAQEAVRAGRVDDAADLYQKALGYDPESRPAIQGLSELLFARALAAEQRGLWGQAWLWHQIAYDAQPSEFRKQKLDAARQAVRHRVAFAVQETAPAPGDAVKFERLRRSFRSYFERGAPPTLRWMEPGQATPGPAYRLSLAILTADVQQRVAQSQAMIHRYPATREEANPRSVALQTQLSNATKEFSALSVDHSRWKDLCYRERLEGHRPRPNDACDQADRVAQAMDAKRFEIRRLEDALRREPPTQRVNYQAEWPYTVNTIVKEAKLSAAGTLSYADSGLALATLRVERSRDARDTQTMSPRPDLGLPRHEPNLPTDVALAQAATDAAAEQLAHEAVVKLLGDQATAVNHEAQKLEATGKTEAAMELNADAAMLLETIDPAQSKRILDQLRARLRK